MIRALPFFISYIQSIADNNFDILLRIDEIYHGKLLPACGGNTSGLLKQRLTLIYKP